jgi:hypothetical protein
MHCIYHYSILEVFSDHYPISIVCDTDCEQRIDTDIKDGKVKINWEKVDKECYSEMVNQEI